MKKHWKRHTLINGYEVAEDGAIRVTKEGKVHGCPEPVRSLCRTGWCIWLQPIDSPASLILREEGMVNLWNDA